MATILFSSLSNNQTIAFDPLNDVLSIDDSGLSAALLTLDYAADYTWNGFTLGGKTLFFGNSVNLARVTTGNVIFADNSWLLVGDNTTGTAGDASANTLIATAQSDYLMGLGGADTLMGGAGDDTYVVNDLGDVVTENAAAGTDTVYASVTRTLSANVENLVLTGTANLNGTGNALANRLTGNSGNNTLDGGAGADTLAGGAGNDTYLVDDPGDVVSENAGEGTDTVQSSLTYALSANVENLTLIGVAVSNGTGNALNNVLIGNGQANTLTGHEGNDTLLGGSGDDVLMGDAGDDFLAGDYLLDGGNGNDTMFGGAGNDLYIVENIGDQVIEYADEGTDSVQSSVTHTLSANVENLTLTGSGHIDGTGNSLNNTLMGNSGNNVLDGGNGSDTVSYANATAGVTVNLALATAQNTVGGGIDTLLNLENLIGSTFNDVLTGTSGDNVLDGGAGYDAASYANATAGVTVNLATGMATGFGNDTLIDIEHFIGSAYNDVITGTADNNYLNGGAGYDAVSYANATGGVTVNLALSTAQNTGFGIDTLLNIEHFIGSSFDDVIIGTAGANYINGGAGSDTVSYANATGGVTVNLALATAQNTGFGTDTLRNIEHLIGSAYNDVFIGTSGNNHFNGGAGYDAVSYANATGGVTVNLTLSTAQNTGFGTDTLLNIEHLIGSAYDDTFTGTAGTNYLNGGAGFDTVRYVNLGGVTVNLGLTTAQNTGGGGVDTLRNIEALIGTNYNDTLIGDTGNNRLDGYAGNDTINGNAGDDLIRGGGGNDTLTGGSGLDIFRFDVAPNASTNLDTLTDFNATDDTIQLENAVFTLLTSTGTLAAGNFSNTGTAADADDYIVYNPATGALYYDADGNGAGAAVQFALLGTTVHPTITAADFVVT